MIQCDMLSAGLQDAAHRKFGKTVANHTGTEGCCKEENSLVDKAGHALSLAIISYLHRKCMEPSGMRPSIREEAAHVVYLSDCSEA